MPPDPAVAAPTHSRRVALKRLGVAVGVVVVGSGAVAVSEGDTGGDAEHPLFSEWLLGSPPSDGPTVVLLPGLGATTRIWKSRVTALTAMARVILVDLLGSVVHQNRGRSRPSSGTLRRCVRCCYRFLRPIR